MVNRFSQPTAELTLDHINYPSVIIIHNHRSGDPSAFGGHIKAYASGHLCHISGNSAESNLVSGANRKYFSCY